MTARYEIIMGRKQKKQQRKQGSNGYHWRQASKARETKWLPQFVQRISRKSLDMLPTRPLSWLEKLVISLLFLGILLPELARAQHFATAPSNARKVKDLVNERLVIDPSTQHSHSDCARLADWVAAATTQAPWSMAHILRVLENPDVSVVCSSGQAMQVQLPPIPAMPSSGKPKEVMVHGRFFHEQNAVYFPLEIVSYPEEHRNAMIRHEFLHADRWNLHRPNGPCPINGFNAVAPVYPYTRANIQQLHRAFDKGDKRIQHFHDLWLKHKGRQRLSNQEKATLDTYIKASQGCGLGRVTTPISEAEHKQVQAYKRQGRGYIKTTQQSEGRAELKFLDTWYDAAKKQFFAQLEYTDPVFALFMLLNKINTLMDVTYRAEITPPPLRAAERETYTFERLDDAAIQTFYPEAYALAQDLAQRCGKQNPSIREENDMPSVRLS